MKRILSLFLPVLFFLSAQGQTQRVINMPGFQQLGTLSTQTRINGVLYPQVGYAPAMYTDTGTANANSYLKNIPFAQMSTSSDGKNWYRNADATKWELLGVGSTLSNIGSGYRLAVPGTNNVKTLFAVNGLTLDSSSNANALTFKLGSPLTENTTINGNYNFTLGGDSVNFYPDGRFRVYAQNGDVSIYSGAGDAYLNGQNLYLGIIGSVSSTTGRKVLIHDTATGKVERIDPATLVSTPTLQQVLTAGSDVTTPVDIRFNSSEQNLIQTDDLKRIINFSDDNGIYIYNLNNGQSTLLADPDNVIIYRLLDGKSSSIIVRSDSIILNPNQGQLYIDSLRTWSGISDTTYKKPMTWDTRNGRWEYAANWYGGGGGSQDLQTVTDNGNTTTNSIQLGSVDPLLSLKQATSNQEFKIRVGVGTGVASQVFNIYNQTAGKHLITGSTNRVIIGNPTDAFGASTLYIKGYGANGSNLDVQPDSAVMDEGNIEIMASDYTAGRGIAMRQWGNVGAGSSVMGYQKKNMALLDFTEDFNLIRTNLNRSLRFGTNNIERMVLDSNGRLGIGTTAPTSWLQVYDQSGSITTAHFDAHEDRAGEILNVTQNGIENKKFSVNSDGSIEMQDVSTLGTPSTPASNYGKTYVRQDSLRFKNDAGTEFTLGAGGGSGVNTVGTFSGSSQTNGASISGSTITFGPADGTNPGMVSTGAQTWAGVKTFSSAPTISTLTTRRLLFNNDGSVKDTSVLLYNSNGELLVNTSSDAGDYKLQVNGQVYGTKFDLSGGGGVRTNGGSELYSFGTTKVFGSSDIYIQNSGISQAIYVGSAIVINNGSLNADFNVKGDNNANLLYADASADAIGVNTNTPNSLFDVAGSLGAAITTTSTNLTLNATHYTVIVTSGTPTITLPAAASGNSRRIYVVVNQTGSGVTISSYLDFTGAGNTTVAANSAIKIQSNGTNWYRIL